MWITIKCVECKKFIADMQTNNVVRIPIILCRDCYDNLKKKDYNKYA